MNEVHAMNFLKECAASAYGSGSREGTSGGKGNIGLLNGHVVKFRTHIGERRGEITEDMETSSQALKAKMGEALEALNVDPNLKDQILNNDFKLEGQKSLLDRKVMANAIKKIETAKNITIFDLAKGAYDRMSSKGVDTTFENVEPQVVMRKAYDIIDEFLKNTPNLEKSDAATYQEMSEKQKLSVFDLVSQLIKLMAENINDEFNGFLHAVGTYHDPGEFKSILDGFCNGLDAAIAHKNMKSLIMFKFIRGFMFWNIPPETIASNDFYRKFDQVLSRASEMAT